MLVHPAVRGLWSVFVALVLFGGIARVSHAQDDLPGDIDAEGVQTLTRGPVHEAFASPTVADPEPGLIVPKAPPEDIREQPPEYQPEGQNVQWYPGYWAWDEDREDYIWISGAWRDPPPGKRWVPGYWAVVPGGFQWVAGFWIDEVAEEFEYQQPPPQSLEQGPSMASPGDDHFYVPGNWNYVNNDYRWQAGYYAPYREDWVYCPARWVWTPRGCIFVNGYWDWRVPRRGQIFAPVFFSPVVYQRPAFFYTPRCTINTSNLFVHLWVRPNYSHYYFGNYYGPTYANRNFTAWCNFQSRPRCYDPLLTYCNVHYRRQGINYAGRMQGWHTHYNTNVHERPANTWHDQIAHVGGRPGDRPGDRPGGRPGPQTRPTLLGEDLNDVIRRPEPTRTWKKLDVAARDQNKNSIEQIKQLHNLRLDQEKVSFVNTPGRRPGAGLDKPSDQPDLKLPGNTRPGRPDRTPGAGPKPGIDPGKVGVVAGADGDSKPGKFRLPKPALASNRPETGKPAIRVPEAPEQTIVNRPTNTRPGNSNPSGGKPIDGTVDNPIRTPGLRNPGAIPGANPANTAGNTDSPARPGRRPEVGNKIPTLDPPANSTVGNPPTTDPVGPKPLVNKPMANEPQVGPRPGRDPVTVGGNETPKKPNLGGSSAASAAQQRIEAIRQQQQEAIRTRQETINNLRNPSGNKPNTPRIEAPKVETPRVDTPRVNLNQRDTPKITRPPVTSGGNNPPKNEGVPRNLTPSNPPPRISKPTIERNPTPRVNSAPSVVPRSNPAPRVEPRSNTAPRVVPRSNPAPSVVPRTNTAPRVDLRSNPGNSGNNNGEKRKGR